MKPQTKKKNPIDEKQGAFDEKLRDASNIRT